MKLKKKFGAFALSLALLGGGLVGCGNSAPSPVTPVVVKYTVYKVAQHCTIGGISDEGYAEGTEVLFTVTPDSGYEVKSVTVDGTAVTPDNQGNYKFTMPDHKVTINAAADEIKVFDLSFAPALKITFESAAQFTFGGVAYDKEWSIAATAATASKVNITDKKVTPVETGEVEFVVTYNGSDTFNKTFTIADIEPGDTEDNPMTAKAAHDLCAALPAGGKSDRKYFVTGTVQEIIAKDTNMSGTQPYASFWLEDEFEVYKTNFADGKAELFDLGSKIVTEVTLNHYKSESGKEVMESTAMGNLSKVDNTTPFAITAKNDGAAIKVGSTETPEFRIAPKGSATDVTLQVTSSDPTVATFTDGTINALKAGLTKLTVKYGTLKDLDYNVVVHNADHAGTVADPMTTKEIVGICELLPDGVKVGPFTYSGVVKNIEEEWNTKYSNITFNIAEEDKAFKCYHVGAVETTEALIHDKIVKGALVTLTTNVQNYKGNTPENDGGAVIAADASKVRLIETNVETLKISLQETEHTRIEATTYPTGINEAVRFGIAGGEAADVVTIGETTGEVVPLRAGKTIVFARAGDGYKSIPVEVIDGSVQDIWEAADGVLPDGATLYNPGTVPYAASEAAATENYVVGKIVSIENTTYGNMHIVDKDGNNSTTLYGTYDKTGAIKYGDLTVKPEVGNVIIVLAKTFVYTPKSGDPYNEIKNGKILQIDGEPWANPELSGVKLSAPSAELLVGAKTTLEATPIPTDAILDKSAIVWASADNAKVKVTPNSSDNAKCEVEGIAATGDAVKVSATVEGKTPGECLVTVTESPEGEVTVEKTMSEIVTENGYTVSSGTDIGDKIKTLTPDSVLTITGSGGGNTGSFWGTSPNNDWRLYCYSDNPSFVTFAVAEGYKIKTVSFVFTVQNAKNANEYDFVSGTEYTVNASSKEFRVTEKDGVTKDHPQLRIKSFKVVYEKVEA